MWSFTRIGETMRFIQVRIKENKKTIIHNHVRSSTLAEHSKKMNRHTCIEDQKILAKVDLLSKGRVREAKAIMEDRCLNIDNGLKLSKS